MLPLTPPPPKMQKQNKPTPLNQIVVSKLVVVDQQTHPPELTSTKSRTATLLRPPRRTNPIIWCAAVLCLIFSLLLILAGIATLILFLVIKPRHPLFDTVGANLNSIYVDSPEYLNGDFAFLANFSNPNRKIDVRFEYLDIELYFFDRLIATQALQPFSQRRGETRLESVRMVSSEVYLPPNLAMELQKQVQNNRVVYNMPG
ncbi:PREDICTED: uncharacterized protein At1g08160 isoform X1 [Nelumbo nucifera]|uniref:Uncharacterized protein At1g08160 isoform X1 n=1 Tax=Nelumbo nucifera TaxID=4432 RepID=A0A1U8Q294_NELNU|nr:PREDICTED: uncharacterized protein At1g08160 isoform X1 [Nelumbo nucifera]